MNDPENDALKRHFPVLWVNLSVESCINKCTRPIIALRLSQRFWKEEPCQYALEEMNYLSIPSEMRAGPPGSTPIVKEQLAPQTILTMFDHKAPQVSVIKAICRSQKRRR